MLLHRVFLVAAPRELPLAHGIQAFAAALACLHSLLLVCFCGVGPWSLLISFSQWWLFVNLSEGPCVTLGFLL